MADNGFDVAELKSFIEDRKEYIEEALGKDNIRYEELEKVEAKIEELDNDD